MHPECNPEFGPSNREGPALSDSSRSLITKATGNDIATANQLRALAAAELAWVMKQAQGCLGNGEFASSSYADVMAFFDETASNYDSDRENPFWSLGHDLLKHFLKKYITDHFHQSMPLQLFDAGGGTGNWTEYLLATFPQMSSLLFDMNASMLRVAHIKLSIAYHGRCRLVTGNLENLREYPSYAPNLIICLHNVIGMVRNDDLVLRNLHDYLQVGGLAIISACPKYHAVIHNFTYGQLSEVGRVIQVGTAKFKAEMPEMYVYTPDEFRWKLIRAGFSVLNLIGYPVSVHPDAGDTKLLKRSTNFRILRDPILRRALLAQEKVWCENSANAYKATNLLLGICTKLAEDTGSQ